MNLRLITFLMTSVAGAVASDFWKVDLYGPPQGHSNVKSEIVATVVCGDGRKANLSYTHSWRGDSTTKTITIRCRITPKVIKGGPLPPYYELKAEPIWAGDERAIAAAKREQEERVLEQFELMNLMMDASEDPKARRLFASPGEVAQRTAKWGLGAKTFDRGVGGS
ncbi:hypothetical protein MCOR02_005476 [Pyricularia oryzae]|uniref:Uncharacterized protein n=2 Tax=Pyricularia TaxID=48558 RepID=A0ABQ8NCZ1_PYRGI|nr:hypothetical protein MCOR02_005476 [Pyricularia oryzae]KAI6295063.1 hypothetical protein MCOR33_007951 [Pyricularia grisea]